MTRFAYDRFAKQYLQELLCPLGEVEISRDIASEVRQIDVLFVPKPQDRNQNETAVRALGLLGKIATTPALLEPFRNPATSDEICSCIGKLFDFDAERKRLASREDKPSRARDRPQLWILSPTASKSLLNGFWC